MSPTLGVGGIALHEGKILLVERGREPGLGLWALPGGHVEAGETMENAVVREMAEETGLVVECGPLRGWVQRIFDEYHMVIFDFDVSVVGSTEPAAGDDAAEVRWCGLGDLEGLPMVPGMVEFLVDHGVMEHILG